MNLFKRCLSVICAAAMTVTLFALPSLSVTAAETNSENGVTFIDFESDGGWSGTNCVGNVGTLSRVEEPGNASNHIMKLYAAKGQGCNFELASSSTSKDAYIMEPNTTYTVTFKYKMESGSAGGAVSIRFGSGASYVASKPKYTAYGVNASAGTDSTPWTEFTYTFTTTAEMKYSDYVKDAKYDYVMDRLYIVLYNASSGATVYVDDIKIKNHNAATYESTTIDFEGAGSYSGTNCESGMIEKTVEPGNESNHVLRLDSKNWSGYNFEIISSNDSNTAYILTANTTYNMSFKYKVTKGSSEGTISPHFGTQAAYSASLPKYRMLDVKYPAATDSDSEWYTYSFSFTTSANMKYNEYDSQKNNTNIVNKLYLVNSSSKSTLYIDDITITKKSSSPAKPEEKAKYEIKNFTHEPYKTAVKGDSASQWYVSRRMYADTIDGNSLLVYQYALDVQADLIGQTNNGSGNRGNSMGTNGSSTSASALVTENGAIAEIVPGKAYRISFKYKVVDVTNESYIGFTVERGKYSSGWTPKSPVGSSGRYIFAAEYVANNEWKDASYTFLADYTTELDQKYLNISVCGYGVAYMDDFVIEEIDESEVEPLPDVSNFSFSVSNGTATITNYSGKTADLEIPDKYNGLPIREIAEFAFLNATFLKSVTIPESVKTIGAYAFENCSGLETVSIPASCTSIGNMAFAGCSSLKGITVNSNNTSYVSENGVLYNKDKTFLIAYPATKTDAEFTIPSTVTEIGIAAFKNALNLKKVNFPASLKKIGASAFAFCVNLNTAALPDTVTEIGSSAFRGCSALENFNLPTGALLGDNVFLYCNSLYVFGDVDKDKTVTNADAVALMNDIATGAIEEYSYLDYLAADVNGDGIVDLLDVAIIQRHVAGWSGYEILPSDDYINYTSDDYVSSGSNAELVVNLSNNRNNTLKSTRDINYDPNKENVIIILIIGQSNSTTSVGYSSEYSFYEKQGSGQPTEEVIRPEKGTVYSARGGGITELSDSYDLYNLTDPARGSSTFSGYSPAIGKELHDATGAKIVFVQCANGATGMHEWVKDPENYICNCTKKGNGVLYKNAVRQYTITYQKLAEKYNIINTGYIWNQGEHEESYFSPELCTIHNSETYYNAYLSMHSDIMNDCELDFGGIVMPRSFFSRYLGATDTPQHSRRSTNARDAMYNAANDIDNLFVVSTFAEKIDKTMDDPSNRIHYAQNAYNGMGTEAGKSIASYLGYENVPGEVGVRVLSSDGIILAEFDSNGNLVSGSKTIEYAENTKTLQILLQSVGTYQKLEKTTVNVSEFVDKFGNVDWDKLNAEGKTSFDIVINPAKIISK